MGNWGLPRNAAMRDVRRATTPESMTGGKNSQKSEGKQEPTRFGTPARARDAGASPSREGSVLCVPGEASIVCVQVARQPPRNQRRSAQKPSNATA